MTTLTAKKIGSKRSVMVYLVAILLIEIIQFIIATKGDFANGLLFFVEGNLNLFTLIVVVFFLIIYAVIGGFMGREILLRDKNVLIVSLRNSLITFVSYCIFLLIIIVFATGNLSEVSVILDKNIRNELILFMLMFLIIITIIWLVIGFRIYKLKVRNSLV